MARFLNKKEDVIDLKLTSYGKHLLGVGKFKPVYYAFYDDNIIYDSTYSGRSEVQSEAHKRIKEETQYIEGLTLFQDLEKNINRDGIGEINFFSIDIEPTQEIPRKDIFKFDQMIGDAYLQGGAQVAPAWKVVALQGRILSSSFMDKQNNSRVPQLHLTASYKLKIEDSSTYYNESFNSLDPRKFELVTSNFIDDQLIYLETDDQMFYIEEMNTELLVENFDIVVFEYIDKTDGEEFQHLRRKYFDKKKEQITNGVMNYAAANQIADEYEELSPQAVKYYFDLEIDEMIDEKLACKGAEQFNKNSYYIDIDFDCENMAENNDVVYDIYGSAVEAEICLD